MTDISKNLTYTVNYSITNYKTSIQPRGILSLCEINISTGSHKGRVWNYNLAGEFPELKFSIAFQFSPDSYIPGPNSGVTLPLNVTKFFGKFKGIITVNGQLIQLSEKNEVVTYQWDTEKSLFTIHINLKRNHSSRPIPKNNVFANMWIKDCCGCSLATNATGKASPVSTFKLFDYGNAAKRCKKYDRAGNTTYFNLEKFEVTCRTCDQTTYCENIS